MSKTEENLQAGFAGESQARNKYEFYAAIARKEGYHYIAKIFQETADNEKRHAKDQLKRLGKLGDTAANLRDAIAGETYEVETMYPDFAKDAEADGEKETAMLFRQIAKVEKEHAARYQKLLDLVEKGTVYKRDKPIVWKCSVCGYVHEGTEPPKKCPCCQHGFEFYEPADMTALA